MLTWGYPHTLLKHVVMSYMLDVRNGKSLQQASDRLPSAGGLPG